MNRLYQFIGLYSIKTKFKRKFYIKLCKDRRYMLIITPKMADNVMASGTTTSVKIAAGDSSSIEQYDNFYCPL